MKFNENIYKYLSKYFDKTTEGDETLKNALNRFFAPAYALYRTEKISLEKLDLLCDSQCSLIEFVIKVVSSCPDLFIIFTDEEKLKNFV